MNRAQKAERTEALGTRLKGVSSLYLADFTGLSVQRLTELRRQLRAAGAQLVVVKNTLARRAVRGVDFPEIDQFLRGPTALVLGMRDPIAPARILREFAQANESRPAVKAAVVENRLVSPDEVRVLAELPPREQILAAVAGSLTAGVAAIASALNAVIRDLASVIEEGARAQAARETDPSGSAGVS
jgi:large subunit ribosomal protein L10